MRGIGSTWPHGDRFAEVFAAGGLGALVFGTEYEPGAYIVGISRGRRPAAACRSYAD